jgi:hypothetical protein
VLLFIGIAPALGYLGMDLFGAVGAYLASLTFFVSRGVGFVVLKDALNSRVPSAFRATANSLTSFGFRGAFLLTGPLVGYGFDLWGMSTTLYLLAGTTLLIFVAIILPLLLAVRAASLHTRARLPRLATGQVPTAQEGSVPAAGLASRQIE